MIDWADWWTWIPSATSLQPKNEMLDFGLCSTSVDQLGWPMNSNPIHHPSPTKKMKCSFLEYVQLLMISWASRWTWPHLPPLSNQNNEMLIFGFHSTSDDQFGWSMGSNPIHHPSPTKKNKILAFGLCSTSDDRPGWSMDLNPIHHTSPAKKMKCSFLDSIQLLCWPAWSMDSNPIYHPSPAKKMKCSFLDYVQLLMISQVGRWTQTPSATSLQPKKWNAHFSITLNFW